MTVKEIACGVIGGQPRPVQQKIVDFVGKDELFEGDALFAESFGEVNHLCKRNVAIIVALNQEYRGAPSVDGRKRRGLPSKAGGVGTFVRFVRGKEMGNFVVRVVAPVDAPPGSEQIGERSQPESSEVAPVAAAPEADT